MSVKLGPELEQVVRALLDRGSYGNAGEVIAAALQALQTQEKIRHHVREEIDLTYLQALDPQTEWLDGEQVLDEFDAEIDEWERGQQSELNRAVVPYPSNCGTFNCSPPRLDDW